MKRFELDCYEVRESDGGGMSDYHIAYCSTLMLAQKLADQVKGWRNVHPYKKVFTVFDDMEEVEANSKANLRKSGLAKLSAAEKGALGIKE
jgi:hypothetical protein